MILSILKLWIKSFFDAVFLLRMGISRGFFLKKALEKSQTVLITLKSGAEMNKSFEKRKS